MMNEKESLEQKVDRKNKDRIVTSAEKAQYEVFANGTISKERIGEMIDNDLKAVLSFAHGLLRDKEIHDALVDAYYKRYLGLHQNSKKDES